MSGKCVVEGIARLLEGLVQVEDEEDSLKENNQLKQDGIRAEGLAKRPPSPEEKQELDGVSEWIKSEEGAQERRTEGRDHPLEGTVAQELERLIEDLIESLFSEKTPVEVESVLVLRNLTQLIMSPLVGLTVK